MANATDPSVNSISGTDPQNLMEYITRQRIYDSRYWKEECFGLTVADVLEKASKLQCIGNLPTKFLSLVLKLLQLHPETDLVVEAFVDQDDFKYVRALGCMYVRMTARPVDVYETLEAQYRDFRKLRVWMAPEWRLLHMDEFVHQLLTQTHVLGIALPRLPSRKTLEDSEYLTPPRSTALKDVLAEYGGPLQYLQHKALVENQTAAISAWEKWKPPDFVVATLQEEEEAKSQTKKRPKEMAGEVKVPVSDKRAKTKERSYGTLFKTKTSSSTPSRTVDDPTASASRDDGSEAYWNDERARLGLKPLSN